MELLIQELLNDIERVHKNLRICNNVLTIHRDKFYSIVSANTEQAELHLERYGWWVRRRLSIITHLRRLRIRLEEAVTQLEEEGKSGGLEKGDPE